MFSGFFIYIFWIFTNKIISFLKIQVQLFLLGDSAVSDIFNLANQTISVVRRLFVDGSFENLFITNYKNQKNELEQKKFTSSTMIIMFGSLTALILFLILIAPLLSKMYLFDSLDKYKNFIFCFKSLAPLILLIFGMSFFTGLLNANKRFGLSSPAPIVGNIGSVIVLYFCLKLLKFSSLSSLIFCSLAYAGIQCVYLLFVSKSYYNLNEKIFWPGDFIKQINRNALLSMLTPISELISSRLLIFYEEGGVTYINYAHKIEQFVFSILAVSLSSIIAADLSSKAKNKEAFSEEASNNILNSHILILPIYLTILYLSPFLLEVMFGNASSIRRPELLISTIIHVIFSLYFFIQNRILNTIFTTSHQNHISLRGGIIYSILNVVLSFFFIYFFSCKRMGIIWANNVAVVIQFLYLFIYGIRSSVIKISLKDLSFYILSICVSCAFVLGIKKMLFITSFINKFFSGIPYFNSILPTLSFLFLFLVLYGVYLIIFWSKTHLILRRK
jgi:putative peptidoglycan lipid II flippase